MSTILSLAFFLSTWVFGAAPSGWIVGEDFVARTDLKSSLKVTAGLEPRGWALDEKSCRLWVVTEDGVLASFSPRRSAGIAEEGVDQILSEVEGGYFYTRGRDQRTLEQRTAEGTVAKSWPKPWVKSAQTIVRHGGRAWALSNDDKKIWLSHLDADLNETKQTVVSENFELWGDTRVYLDAETKSLWVGFTRTTLTHIYSPSVRRFDFEGNALSEYVGKERGLFFDACLDAGRGLLFSRDLPSDSGYTVPLHSFLETLSPDAQVKGEYAAETNYFIDSLGCRPDRVYMLQRSIFGSDGNHLVVWKRGAAGIGERLTRLPGKGKKLYVCGARG